MPEEPSEWGAAMSAELGHILNLTARWWFALGGIRVALFPPRRTGSRQRTQARQSPICGMLAVLLPPIGLPLFISPT
ncbi:MAG: hypothetical protein ABI882_14900 [Acidobacteriota bacterium]